MSVGDYVAVHDDSGAADAFEVVFIEDGDDRYIVCRDLYKSEAERIAFLLNEHGMGDPCYQ